MRLFIRRIFRTLPTPIQTTFRDIRSRIPLTASGIWARRVYTPFATQQREYIFMSIVRFLHINRPITGYYMEFGSHGANTMRMAWDCFHHFLNLDYIAFDSFKGLPEISSIDRQQIWEKGKLCTEEKKFISLCKRHGMDITQLRTVPGFYDQSLTHELRETLSKKKAAVIYIDCDLYTSTIPVLEFARHFLQQGTVIVFDDWNCFWADPEKGERRAWAEFCAKYPELKFEEFISTGMQKAFVYINKNSQI